MLAVSVQSWAVAMMVAAAAAYLGWSAWRALGRRRAGSCCERGCAPLGGGSVPTGPAGHPAGGTPFIPLDNLADQARRHRQRRHDAEREPPGDR